MFGKLKEKAVNGAISKVEELAGPTIKEKVDTFKSLTPSDVQDDAKYTAVIVNPIWSLVKLQIGPAESLAKKVGIDVQDKIEKGLFHVRDELISVQDDKVKLDPEFNSKIVPTLMEAFKK